MKILSFKTSRGIQNKSIYKTVLDLSNENVGHYLSVKLNQ